MVDLRPLLFINFLMILLLITAGFTAVNTEEHIVKDEIPEPWVSNTNTDTAIESGDLTPSESDSSPKNDKSAQVLASLKLTEEAAFAEEAIFADELPATDLPITETQKAPHFSAGNTDDFEVIEVTSEEAEAPKVIAYENTPPPISKPITTGTLIVRSNVSEDTVLVNGKPYGPTKLELQLTPGSYNIEVTKEAALLTYQL